MTTPQWPSAHTTRIPWKKPAPQGLSRRALGRVPAHVDIAVVPHISGCRVHIPLELHKPLEQATLKARSFSSTHPNNPALHKLLLRGEAIASSRIEHISATARKLLEAEHHFPTSHDAALVAANTNAMRVAMDGQGPATADALLKMHHALLHKDTPEIAGTFRDSHVWIGGDNTSPAGADYIGPAPETIEESISDLIAFINHSPYPGLVTAAIAHAHFETIHPFADGNGRTGRALIHVILAGTGITDRTPLPVSAVLLRDTRAYFQALTHYREGNPWDIVELFIHATMQAADLATDAARELDHIHHDWQQRCTSRRDTPDRDILAHLVHSPIVTMEDLHTVLPDASTSTLGRSLKRLEDLGIVREDHVTKNTRAWRAPEVLELLDEFAANIGCRTL